MQHFTLGKAPLLSAFGDIFGPHEAAEPILAEPIRGALLEWLTEIWAEEDLREVGIQPRRKAIFDGAPGVGKTTLAHHLAARLGLTMLAVRPDRLIDSYLGATGQNIGDLFTAAAKGQDGAPIVLFLDEFDAIAPKRGTARSGAAQERNAYVNTLLQRLEQFSGFVIAATNFGKHIDPAIWRRFDIHITLQIPGQRERELILERYLAPYALQADSLTALAAAFDTASPALMRSFCEGLKRQLVIGPKLDLNMDKLDVIHRIVASVHPHPELGKPPLWVEGAYHPAISVMPWPLNKASQ